jgi:quercetin dioxygenase-like cupin family protein
MKRTTYQNPLFKENMNPQEVETGKSMNTVQILEYVTNSVVIKTIIKKSTGNITVVSLDSGETMAEKISPFDTFIQVIEGTAEIIIDAITNTLNTGEAIIIPAYSKNKIHANVRFKMISTTIKSGNE